MASEAVASCSGIFHHKKLSFTSNKTLIGKYGAYSCVSTWLICGAQFSQTLV